MALVPHVADKEGRKIFKEKLTAAKAGGKAGADKVKGENNIDLDGKPVIKPATTRAPRG